MIRKIAGAIKATGVLLFCLLLSLPLNAQQAWTLRQCIDYALAHNISIKQKDNQRIQQEYALSTARNQRLPDLSASASESFSFGRGLTMDNTYTNRSTSSTGFSVGTSIPLFTGFQIPNSIRLNQLNLEAAVQDLEKAREDVSMQVAQAYVEVLYDMEIADVARRQIVIDSLQVCRLDAFVTNGKASEAERSQQLATLAQSRLTATQADNNLQMALLTLSQLLELPTPEGFSIVRPRVGESIGSELPSPDAVYAEAITQKPGIRAEQLRLQGAESNVKIAQAGYYPTLSLSGGLQTNYYKTSGLSAESFATQLKNNFAQYIGLNLSVPIFNRFQTRNNIRSAKMDRENQLLQLDYTKKQLYKEIQQVYYNARAARMKYESSMTATASAQDAFTLVQAKYENGKATITEFNESKNSYLKTESDLVQARYEYLYQVALLDFYRGRSLDF